LAAMIGGVLFLAGPLFYDLQLLSSRDVASLMVLTGLSLVAAFLLQPVAMVGFYALHPHLGARLVIVGSLATALGGTVFFTLGEAGDFLQASPPLAWVALGLLGLVAGLVFIAEGFVIYGIVVLRSGALPRWCGVAFIATPPVALVSGIVSGIVSGHPATGFTSIFVVFGIAWLALGYALWARREAPAAQQFRQVR
jgi:hypothetical protein